MLTDVLERNFKREKMLEKLESVEDGTKESCTLIILNIGPTHSYRANVGRPIKGSRFPI